MCSRSGNCRNNSGNSGGSGRPGIGSGTREISTSIIDGGYSDGGPSHGHLTDSLDAAVFDSDPDRVSGSTGGDEGANQILLEEPCDPEDCEIHSAHTLHVVIARNGAITAVCAHQSHLFVSCSQMLWTYSLYSNAPEADGGSVGPSARGGAGLADGSRLRNLPTPSGVKVLQPFVAMTVDSVANVLLATDSVHGVTIFRCAVCFHFMFFLSDNSGWFSKQLTLTRAYLLLCLLFPDSVSQFWVFLLDFFHSTKHGVFYTCTRKEIPITTSQCASQQL